MQTANLTDAYRTRVRGLVDNVQGQARELWAGMDMADIDGSFGPIGDRVTTLVATAQRTAVRSSTAYLTAVVANELGKPQRPGATDSSRYVGKSFQGQELRRALDAARIVTLQAIKAKDPDPLGQGRRTLLNAIDLNVKAAGRQALQDAMEASRHIDGWRRSVKGTCDACLGLAQESTLPPGTPLDVHPNCECVSEPSITQPTLPWQAEASDYVDGVIERQGPEVVASQGKHSILQFDRPAGYRPIQQALRDPKGFTQWIADQMGDSKFFESKPPPDYPRATTYSYHGTPEDIAANIARDAEWITRDIEANGKDLAGEVHYRGTTMDFISPADKAKMDRGEWVTMQEPGIMAISRQEAFAENVAKSTGGKGDVVMWNIYDTEGVKAIESTNFAPGVERLLKPGTRFRIRLMPPQYAGQIPQYEVRLLK